MIAPNNQKTVRTIGLCLLIAMAMAYEATAGYSNESLTKLGFFVSTCLIVSGMEVEGIPRVGLVSAIIEG